MPLRFAASTASLPADSLTLALAKIAWAGFEGVELAAPEGASPEAEARARLAAEELTAAAVHAGPLPETSEDLEALGRVGRAAALARALDGGLVVVEAPAAGTSADLAASLALLDRALGGLAVDVALVNRPGTLAATPADLAGLWGLGLPTRTLLALDPGAACDAGWDPADLNLLPALPGYVYLTDRRAGRPVPPGEGDLDFPRLAAALGRAGYAGWLCLRLEGADPWAVEPLLRETREAAAVWFSA